MGSPVHMVHSHIWALTLTWATMRIATATGGSTGAVCPRVRGPHLSLTLRHALGARVDPTYLRV